MSIPEDPRIPHGEMSVWGDQFMLQYQAHFDERSQERGRLEMPDRTVTVRDFRALTKVGVSAYPMFPLTLPMSIRSSRAKVSPAMLASMGSPTSVPRLGLQHRVQSAYKRHHLWHGALQSRPLREIALPWQKPRRYTLSAHSKRERGGLINSHWS